MKEHQKFTGIQLSLFVLANKTLVFIWLPYGLAIVVIKLNNSKRSAWDLKQGEGDIRAEICWGRGRPS